MTSSDERFSQESNPNIDLDANEFNKQKEEAMQFFETLTRRQRRKMFKPTFTRSVREAFRKKPVKSA